MHSFTKTLNFLILGLNVFYRFCKSMTSCQSALQELWKKPFPYRCIDTIWNATSSFINNPFSSLPYFCRTFLIHCIIEHKCGSRAPSLEFLIQAFPLGDFNFNSSEIRLAMTFRGHRRCALSTVPQIVDHSNSNFHCLYASRIAQRFFFRSSSSASSDQGDP